MKARLTTCSITLALVAAACQSAVRPDPAKIAAWTAELRDSQPEHPVAAVYVRGDGRLVFIAAHHENRTDSPTFRLIADAYALTEFDTLITEGSPYSRGPNARADLEWLAQQVEVDGFVEGGETVPAGRGALAQGANIWGGEPDDTEIRDRLRAEGFSDQDLLGFYILRSVPQWAREREIEGPDDARIDELISAELERNRGRLGVAPSVLRDAEAWRRWYETTNGRPFGASFVLEEVGPRADGRFASNRIGAAIGRARDAFLLETIARHVNTRESVIVVFGQSHLMMLRPALDHILGPPCYIGADLRSAPAHCFS